MMKKLLITLVFISVILPVWGQSERPYIREGNEQYANGAYENAEVSYRRALDLNPESFEASVNLGNALYKQQKYQDAMQQYQTVGEKELTAAQKAELFYNIGNAHFNAKELEKSIEAYKNALRYNPSDREARYNLAKAQQQLQQQQQQQQQQQEEEEQQNQNQDQNQEEDTEKEEQNQEENQNENQNQNQNQDQMNENQDTDKDGIPDKTEKGENENEPRDTDGDGTPDYQDKDSDNDGLPDEYEAGSKPEEPKDMDNDGTPDYRDTDSDNDGTPDSEEQIKPFGISVEDALRILQALEDEEKEVQERLQEVEPVEVEVEKNW